MTIDPHLEADCAWSEREADIAWLKLLKQEDPAQVDGTWTIINARIDRLIARAGSAGGETEDEMDERLIHADHADNLRLLDWIADRIGVPHDEELTREHVAEALASPAMEGWVMVPREPTWAMLNAAIDVDSYKLGDISPLGFRMSPHMLFEKCYAAMLVAAPPAAIKAEGE